MFPSFEFFGRQIGMYGVFMVVGIVVAAFFACRRAVKRQGDDTMVIILAVAAVFLALLGARLAYYLVSYPGGIGALFAEISAGDLHGLREGGLVFYGGLILAVAGVLLLMRLLHLDTGLYCDAIMPCIPLGHAFGRIGCTFAGCCYGMEYAGFGAIRSVNAPEQLHFPVQPLEAALNFLLFLALVQYTKKPRRGLRTLIVYAMAYGVIRFALEFLRGDGIRGVFGGLSTSQWISLALLLMGTAIMLIRGRTAHQ